VLINIEKRRIRRFALVYTIRLRQEARPDAEQLVLINSWPRLKLPVTLFVTGLLSGTSAYTGNHQYTANHVEWFLFWSAIIGSTCGWFFCN